MGWSEYHNRTEVYSFGDQQHTYFGAINNLARRNPAIANSLEPKTFVLGGFHPFYDTAQDFMKFCKKISSHPRDRHILLDQSLFPLTATNIAGSVKVQAKLEGLPFQPGSIDYIFLDNTLDFMDTEQVQKFSADISSLLKPDGLVLAMTKDPVVKPFARVWGRIRNHVPTHYYSTRNLKQATSPFLKIVLEALNDTGFFKNCNLRTFARPDSCFSEHQGLPYVYDRDFHYPQMIGMGPVTPNGLEVNLNPGSLELQGEPLGAFGLQPVSFTPGR